MLLAFSGAFFTDTFAKGQETSLPKKTVLLRSSKNAQLIDGKSMRSARMGQIPLREAVQNYKKSFTFLNFDQFFSRYF